ncbi:hypothetical protein [Kitasatospora sp. NPDC089509]|uniref:hypothetical protein n=1 Tax=Kitasatospora sp. NPDC089509 TaxID=3364079 RepID=UPI00380E3B81
MIATARRGPLRLWGKIRADFHAGDVVERWTARAAWAMATVFAWMVSVIALVWAPMVAGVPEGVAGLLFLLVSVALPIASACAVTAAPTGRTGRPVLVAVILICCTLAGLLLH